MVSIFDFVISHAVEIGELVCAVIGVASIIVKLTPNKKDDLVFGKIKRFISTWIALNPKKRV